MTTTPPDLQSLYETAKELLMPSEADAPFTSFFWPDADIKSLSPERVQELSGAPADAKVESLSVQSFFRDVTTEEEWHNDEETATVQKFKALVKAIKKTLDEPRVFRIGETEIDCFIAGGVKRIAREGEAKPESGVGGLQTRIVET